MSLRRKKKKINIEKKYKKMFIKNYIKTRKFSTILCIQLIAFLFVTGYVLMDKGSFYISVLLFFLAFSTMFGGISYINDSFNEELEQLMLERMERRKSRRGLIREMKTEEVRARSIDYYNLSIPGEEEEEDDDSDEIILIK